MAEAVERNGWKLVHLVWALYEPFQIGDAGNKQESIKLIAYLLAVGKSTWCERVKKMMQKKERCWRGKEGGREGEGEGERRSGRRQSVGVEGGGERW